MSSLDLARSHFLVTGATGNIGRAIVTRLCKEFAGATITIVARTPETLEQFANELKHEFGEHHLAWMPADVSDVIEWWPKVDRSDNPVTHVIDCTGSWPGPLKQTPEECLQDLDEGTRGRLTDPLRVVVNLCTVALEHFKMRRHGQLIWAGGSIAAIHPFAYQADYCAQKSAIRAWLCVKQIELQQDNLQECSVEMVLSGIVEGTDTSKFGMRVEGELVTLAAITDAVMNMIATGSGHEVVLPGNYTVF